MQQKNKGLVVLSFVLLIICATLALLAITLVNLTGTNQPIPISYPDATVNTIRIIPKSLEKYVYATISSEDTIVLKDISNEKRGINLEHRKWKDIKWSPDYTLIGVLGLSEQGKYNIYIYNLATERWSQVTNYSDFGVEDFFWYNNDQVNFIQGDTDQKWLHSYKYSTENQILKLNLIRGTLVRTNEDKKILVFKEGNDFVLRDAKGALIMPISEAKINFEVKDVIVMTDISQLILLDENNNLHLYDLVKEKILNVFETLESPTLMCAQDENFKFFTRYNNDISVETLSTLDYTQTFVSKSFTTDQQDLHLKRCNSKFYLINAVNNGSKWFNNSEFAEIVTLDGDLDADVKITK